MRNEISVKWQALRFGTQPEERAVIETIVFLRRQGCEFKEIANTLNARNLPAKKGGVWSMLRVWQTYQKAIEGLNE